MAVIEKRFCVHHGMADHFNNRCEECSQWARSVRVAARAHMRDEFEKLPAHNQIMQLYDILKAQGEG